MFTTGQRYTNQFRLNLSYPIFNQFQREQSVVQADVSSSIADANLRDARLAARQNLIQYLGALRTAEGQVMIQSTSVAAAEEDLRVQQQRYALGVSTLLDELTSEAALISARASLIQARFTYRVAKAQLSALVGGSCDGPKSGRVRGVSRLSPGGVSLLAAAVILAAPERETPAVAADGAGTAPGHRGGRRPPEDRDQRGADQVQGLGQIVKMPPHRLAGEAG